jgi:ribosomal protein S18 acetylase RimI-like enzyme
MNLVPLQQAHPIEMQSWFPDARSCAIWGGPQFRFPFTEASFREDLQLQLPSFALLDDDDALAGFGQYYPRADRCHLARLVIAPGWRGRALGALLIRELCRIGCAELCTDECSLFVLEDNTPALRCYTRLGFAPAGYPGEMPKLPGSLYLTAPLGRVSGLTDDR